MPKKSKRVIAYHFTDDTLRDGRPIPPIGEWLEETGELILCVKGLHASRTPFQALAYAPGFKLHTVEVEDIAEESDDKLVARRRKILATIDARDLILEFARNQALSVIHLYDCPPVLKKWLETGDPALQKDAADAAARKREAAYAANAATTYAAACAASAANAAYYAANAAYYAAYAAKTAANKKKAAETFNTAIQRRFTTK